MNKVAIITGAGSGIGRATVLAFHGAGYDVVLAGRREAALLETAALATQGTGGLKCVPTDITDEAAVRALFDTAVEAFGRVDVLFNNAGLNAPILPLEETAVADLRAVIEVNVMGSLLCAREAMRVMKTQTPGGGRIINNGSISAQRPRPHSAAYVAAKHALTGLTQSLLLDGRAFGITAGQVDVGNAVSEMSSHMHSGALQADGQLRREPRMDPANVAKTVLYMAQLPAEANIPFVTVMASGMPFFGRG